MAFRFEASNHISRSYLLANICQESTADKTLIETGIAIDICSGLLTLVTEQTVM